MKVLILGCTGMLGHTISRYLIKKNNIELYGTYKDKKKIKLLKKNICMVNFKNFIFLDINKKHKIIKLIKKVKPDYLINCIGIIKQVKTSRKTMFDLNVALPKFLEKLTVNLNFNLIHLSTDCVFSGKIGSYTEKSIPDAKDLYGRSKFLGEVISKRCLTIRTSIIGQELSTSNGLLEWFLNSKKKVNGFSKFYFSGFPTIILSKIIYKYFLKKKELTINGLIHLSSLKISKLHLLREIKKVYNLNIDLQKVNYPKIDRSLISNKFKSKFKFKSDSWNIMIKKMKPFS